MHWLQRLVCAALRHSPHTPQHVAFIMDGNRRYAARLGAAALVGHERGYQTLLDCLQWSLRMGVTMVSVYAFSADNFQRSAEEVEGLFKLAADRFDAMACPESNDVLRDNGVCVRVLGSTSRLPPSLRESMRRAVDATRAHSAVTLNICMAYGHMQELTDCTALISSALSLGMLHRRDVTARLLHDCMYTGLSAGMSNEKSAAAAAASASSLSFPLPLPVPSSPDLLIRTSGETRLSDFLQSQLSLSGAQLAFSRTLWPDFGLFQMARVVLEYQLVAAERQESERMRWEKEEEAQWSRDEAQARRMLCDEEYAECKSAEFEEDDAELADVERLLKSFPPSLSSLLSSSSSSSASSSSSSAFEAAANVLTTSSDSEASSDECIESESRLSSPSPSPPAASDASSTPPSPLQKGATLRQRFAKVACDAERGEAVIDPERLRACVEQIRSERAQRIAAFMQYARQHTDCLI